MKTHYQQIIQQRGKALSDHGIQTLILRLDYGTYPPQLLIVPAKDFNPHNF